eukprot:1327702-Alexandrium_andersonii.AAC.1
MQWPPGMETHAEASGVPATLSQPEPRPKPGGDRGKPGPTVPVEAEGGGREKCPPEVPRVHAPCAKWGRPTW